MAAAVSFSHDASGAGYSDVVRRGLSLSLSLATFCLRCCTPGTPRQTPPPSWRRTGYSTHPALSKSGPKQHFLLHVGDPTAQRETYCFLHPAGLVVRREKAFQARGPLRRERRAFWPRRRNVSHGAWWWRRQCQGCSG